MLRHIPVAIPFSYDAQLIGVSSHRNSQILNDITGDLDAKKACIDALKLHKKYLKKVWSYPLIFMLQTRRNAFFIILLPLLSYCYSLFWDCSYKMHPNVRMIVLATTLNEFLYRESVFFMLFCISPIRFHFDILAGIAMEEMFQRRT